MLDRFGEPIEDDQPDDELEHDDTTHSCRNGWIDRNADHPVPCLRCRPYLAPQPRKPTPDPEVARAGIAAVRAALAAAKGSAR